MDAFNNASAALSSAVDYQLNTWHGEIVNAISAPIVGTIHNIHASLVQAAADAAVWQDAINTAVASFY